MRRLIVAAGLAFLTMGFLVGATPKTANAFSITAAGTWVSNDGLLNGTWQAHFDVAGYDLSGTLNVLGMPDVADGNLSGSWDASNVGFGVMFLDQELAAFTGGFANGEFSGTFEKGDLTGIWSGTLDSLSFDLDPIVPITSGSLPTLLLSHISGNLGDIVTMAASLQTLGNSIAAIQNIINFDSATPILANALGKPDCSVNPLINKADTIFQFLPLGCSGSGCTQVQAIVKSLTNFQAIADGALLYTCKVKINKDATAGVYQMVVSALKAFDQNLQSLSISSISGQIAAKLPWLNQLKNGCHCSTVEHAGPLPLSSLLVPLAIVALRRRERMRQRRQG